MEEGEVDACNISLVLGLGRGDFVSRSTSDQQRKRPVQFHLLFPSSAMDSSDEYEEESGSRTSSSHNKKETRKKLRLTKEQSTLLEDSFKEHNTLTQAQKKQLSDQLNLKPRQVEVWFQNRRARTKLKQTEVDCEFLKRCCESLSDENRRLKEELQELRSMKLGSPFHLPLPKVGPSMTVTICPSCERTGATAMNSGKTMKNEFYSV